MRDTFGTRMSTPAKLNPTDSESQTENRSQMKWDVSVTVGAVASIDQALIRYTVWCCIRPSFARTSPCCVPIGLCPFFSHLFFGGVTAFLVGTRTVRTAASQNKMSSKSRDGGPEEKKVRSSQCMRGRISSLWVAMVNLVAVCPETRTRPQSAGVYCSS